MMNHYDIVKKLIGEINPVGEHNEDERRYDNLIKLMSLVENLIYDIDDVGFKNKDRQEYSIKRASNACAEFIKRIKDNLNN
jgi:uncharacterized protein YaaR (DUF327 family)